MAKRPIEAVALIDTALFDLDGTLIDSTELIRRPYEHTPRVYGERELTRENGWAALGRPLLGIMAS